MFDPLPVCFGAFGVWSACVRSRLHVQSRNGKAVSRPFRFIIGLVPFVSVTVACIKLGVK